ncbi:fructose-bisphosphate aldolase class I [Candidatus Saccharibacteria bacterium]|nr:fructose-bisphosphate aldolase class I [Candidatus Saccharibacteria bacterium]
MRILIVGNIIKDVYLGLDERQNKFETDENGTPWMDIAFDGGHHAFFSRTSVFGGARVTKEVFDKLGLESSISGEEEKKIADSYRYVLSSGENISYFVPSERVLSVFNSPNNPVDWIFIDRSAEVSDELAEKVKNYLGLTHAKLAIFANVNNFTTGVKELTRVANVVFTDGELSEASPKGVVCTILHREIKCGSIVRRYKVSKNDLMTHLTSYSIIAATIFGAMMNGTSTKDALEMAALNVENSTITESLSLKKLTEMIEKRRETDGNLRLIAKTMVSPGRGILAADESGGSIHKKFEEAGIPDDEEHRRDYRNIFFTTHNLEKYVNGVILFDETARQKADDGSDFVSFLTAKGIVPGIKVDQGLEPFSEPEYATEKWTKGLDDLPERLAEYFEMGARFAKWRAAFEVTLDGVGGDNVSVKTPSKFAIEKNCEILAQYAKDCQNAGIVPIVEPEVVHDGYYSVETCAKITGEILDCLFKQLARFSVNLEGCILKTNMVLAGKKYENQSSPEEVGEWTAKVLREHCPKELAGVVFLSGGQGVEQATENLQAVTNNGPFPWAVTFSYARALQGPALDAWKGDNNNADNAREAFAKRLVENCKALTKNNLS